MRRKLYCLLLRMRSEPYILPTPGAWNDAADVAAWVERCLVAVGLFGWCFGWDRAVKRLGCCHYTKRRITLSRYYVGAYLAKDAEMVRRTILHELAHALAMVHHRAAGHGRVWKHFCGLLGLEGEKASCRCDDFAPAGYRPRRTRYVLCHRETGEVFHRYVSRPRLSVARLARTYIRGRKDETLGKLVILSVNDE